MRIDVLTLFPELFTSALRVGLLGKAIEDGRLIVEATNFRDFAHDRHRTVDDAPFGGGPGMVMACEPVFDAVESLRGKNSLTRVVLMTPRGRRLDHGLVGELAQAPDLAILCGRYEGIDERVSQALVTDEISIGDYVLSGGELPALVLIEAVSRLIPGVIGDWESVTTDSFYDGILGPPQYTRPAEFRGLRAPEVLLSGNHAAIKRWRRKEALRVTRRRRPDLLVNLSVDDRQLLAEIESEDTALDRENES
jgi:tRNA (guanine37-N1)-methyltransferase